MVTPYGGERQKTPKQEYRSHLSLERKGQFESARKKKEFLCPGRRGTLRRSTQVERKTGAFWSAGLRPLKSKFSTQKRKRDTERRKKGRMTSPCAIRRTQSKRINNLLYRGSGKRGESTGRKGEEKKRARRMRKATTSSTRRGKKQRGPFSEKKKGVFSKKRRPEAHDGAPRKKNFPSREKKRGGGKIERKERKKVYPQPGKKGKGSRRVDPISPKEEGEEIGPKQKKKNTGSWSDQKKKKKIGGRQGESGSRFKRERARQVGKKREPSKGKGPARSI